MNEEQILERGREVLRIEAESVRALIHKLDETFVKAVRRIREAPGRIVVSGIGKSGLIARKIASTLASTGTPALFLHPVEGMHGDLGLLVRGDLLLAVSRSGESDELAALIPSVKRLGIPIIAITGEADSSLGRHAELVLDVSVRMEACPNDLAPTSSSTAALAMGDALAMALLDSRGFGPDDFARLHPAGSLGRRLLWTVSDVMVEDPERVPVVEPGASLGEAMHEIAHRRGTVPVMENGKLVGVITAGDLTRFGQQHEDFLSRPVSEAMTRSPRVIGRDALAVEAVHLMEEHGIMALPVLDPEGDLAGMVHLHDLLRAGVA